MNLAIDLTNYIINQDNIQQYEGAIVKFKTKIESELASQPDILDYKTTERISELYSECESYIVNKEKLSLEQKELTKKINQTLNECFLGKSVELKLEINSEDILYLLHPSIYDDELNFELSDSEL